VGRSLSKYVSPSRPGRRQPISRRFALRALVCGALLVTSTALAAPSGPASGVLPAPKPSAPPTRLAIFNNPIANYSVAAGVGDKSAASVRVPGAPSPLTAAIVSLLDSATPRATVTIAMYNASVSDATKTVGDASLVRRALRQTALRVRTLNVLVDGDRDGRAFWKPLMNLPRVTVRQCDSACYHRGSGVMHNKFVLVDDTRWTPGAEHVVLQLTANLSDGQLSNLHWNSAVQLWGDEQLYQAYLTYHRTLFRCAPACSGAPTPQNFAGSAPTGARLAVFPRAGADDPVLAELQALTSCGPGGGVDVTVNDWWQDSRGFALLARLEALARAGCRVRIVVPEGVEGERIGAVLPHSALAATSRCASSRAAQRARGETEGLPQQRQLVPRVHSKYVLMRGVYHGVPNSTIVSTGSERFTGGARNLADETWLSLVSRPGQSMENAMLYAQFKANFDEMYAVTPRCVDESDES
jgi:hypothetical protein